MITFRLLSASALLLASIAVLAGPAGDNAQAHFRAVANGQVDKVVEQYHDQVTLEWVGGPLDGVYRGKEAVEQVWSKFTAAQGPLTVKVLDLQENANPKGATVTANVAFSGKNTIKVRYVLGYRDNRLVNEVWQIDPAMNI